MKKTLFTLLAITFISVASAFARPLVVETSCGTHFTDTELWGGLSDWEIKMELEQICNQSPSTPIE